MNVSDNMAEESTLTVAQESLVTLKQYMNPYDISILLSTCHCVVLFHSLQVNLSVSHDGYLHYGDTVCIFNPASETALSANMSESKMHDEKRLVGPCDVSASKMTDPCIRNTFVIGWVVLFTSAWEHKKILANDLRFMIYKFLLWSPNSCMGYYPGKTNRSCCLLLNSLTPSGD